MRLLYIESGKSEENNIRVLIYKNFLCLSEKDMRTGCLISILWTFFRVSKIHKDFILLLYELQSNIEYETSKIVSKVEALKLTSNIQTE